jgi:PAS domain S-box-containing protein
VDEFYYLNDSTGILRASVNAQSAAPAYLFAIAFTLAAVFGRWLLDPWLGDRLTLVTLFAAVAASEWYGGYRPALLAMVLGYVLCDYLFVRPAGMFRFYLPHHLVGLAAYVTSSAMIIAFGEATRAARRRASEREALLSVTLASIGDAVVTTDAHGRIEYMNAAAERLTGWRERDAMKQSVAGVMPLLDEATRRRLDCPAERARAAGTGIEQAEGAILVAKDGSERPVDCRAAPIRDERGRISGSVLVFRDITARRQTERALARGEEARTQLAAIVAASDDAIVSKSLDGTIRSWNQGAERLFGYAADEAIGQSIDLIIPPERRPEERDILARLRRGERIDHYETVRVARDGRRVDVSLTISPILDEAGRVIGASKVSRDITERKRTEQALRDADRRKDEFLATLAHELRNPLAPIRHSIEILKRAGADPARIQQSREIIERQLGHMVRLVDDLLDLSRITRDKLELRPARVELASVLHQALEACRPLAERHQQRIELVLPEEPVVLDADSVRLVQVFCNLVDNACKYSPPGGTIAITAARAGDEARVTVRDTGIGIPADKLEAVFDMFSQVDTTLERSRGGLGIGLTLVRRLVELHGGRIEARSEGAGLGSEFVVRLPVAPAAAARPVPDAAPRDAGGRTRRILVVDDNHDSAESLSTLLRLSGHETWIAHDGVKALEIAEGERPEIILLDIGLPGLNGLDVCRRIREQPWGRHVVILAMTGWGQDEDRRRSSDAGFDGHLVKPVEPDLLLARVASFQPRQPAADRDV